MSSPTPQGEQNPTPRAKTSVEKAVEDAPRANDKGGKLVQTVWPTNKFVVEDLPVITREGTRLTAEQYKKVEKAAKSSRAKIREVNEEGDN